MSPERQVAGDLARMYTINADFDSFDRVSARSLFGEIGVYVLWSSRAHVRPSYTGEGNVMQRLATEHVNRFGDNVEGYVAIMNEGTEKERKMDAEIVEGVLLQVAPLIDQVPMHNEAGGKTKGLLKLFNAGHYTVRVKFTGYHPLRFESKINGTHDVRLRLSMVGSKIAIDDIEHPWRRSGG